MPVGVVRLSAGIADSFTHTHTHTHTHTLRRTPAHPRANTLAWKCSLSQRVRPGAAVMPADPDGR